jgi:putative membrane protein
MMYWHWDDGYGWAMLVVNLLFWLLAIGGIAWVAVSLLRGDRRRPDDRTDDTSAALSVLKERFARGEIDDDEFRRRRDLLLQ